MIWDGISIATVTTEIDGDFTFTYNIPEDHILGNTTLLAKFDGNDLHMGSNESQIPEIFEQSIVSLQSDDRHFYAGESMILSGSLTYDNGTILPGI